MEVKTEAIVLQIIKYGDAQLIVDFLTERLGRLSFMVNVPRSGKAKVKRQLFRPMMFLDLEFDYRLKSSLQRLKDVAISVPLADVSFSPSKMSISMFLAEFLANATRNEQSNVPLFSFIKESLLWLDGARGGYANFHIVFMLRLTFFLGFSPNLESCVDGDFFDMEEGRFVPVSPAHTHCLGKEESLRMLGLFRLGYETMHLYTMSRLDRDRCVEVILEYYKIHVPGFPEMKSFEVLKELFA